MGLEVWTTELIPRAHEFSPNMNFGIWHNGSTNLPVVENEEGLMIPDCSLREMHADRQRVAQERIHHGVLADKRGFDRLTFTEHHFIITGAEFSPNPLLSQMAVAARTESIKLRQVANIITWHDPIRFAEQTALLDVVSGGRTEIGIGRGYQPREAEVLGQYWGGSVNYEEQNRASFEEKVEILLAAWTQDVTSYRGEFHRIPPSYTRWHHPQERAYLASDATEYDVDDMIDWEEDSVDETSVSTGVPDLVSEGTSTLEAISVFPQPLQDPYPQLWQPVFSPRSIKYAARNGINPYLPGTRDPSLVADIVEAYYDAVEAAGWPDRRAEFDGEPFTRPWDEDRQRGFTIYVPVFNTSVGSADALKRWKEGIKAYWQFIGWFGAAGGLPRDEDEHPLEVLRAMTPELLVDEDLYVAGDADYITDRLAHISEHLDATDIAFDIAFEGIGLSGDETDEQLEAFADQVMPYMTEEFPSVD